MARRITAIHWAGNKNRYLGFILPLLPRAPVYVEPFGGGASVLLNKPRDAVEIYGDLDPRMVNFMRTLRDEPDPLIRSLHLTPSSRTEFRACKQPSDDGIEDARRFHVQYSLSVSSVGIGWSRSKGNKPKALPDRAVLRRAAARLRGVRIVRRDALDVIREHDSPDTLFYLDPPYLDSVMAHGSKFYNVPWHDSDLHSELMDLLRKVKGRVVLSGYRSDMYDDGLPGWTRIDDARKIARLNTVTKGTPRQESIWINHGQG